MTRLPPGVYLTGRQAHLLAHVLDESWIEQRLDNLGGGAKLRREVGAALDEIRQEARSWRAARQREQQGSASGTNQVPNLVELASSPAMNMSTIDAAATLGVSTSYVTRLARSGALPARKSGRDWLLDEHAVRARAQHVSDEAAAA